MAKDIFVGRWTLDPAHSSYEFGEPPIKGTYMIRDHGNGYTFDMACTTVDGQEMTHSFDGIADGQRYPYEVPAIAEFVSLVRVNEHQLDSYSYRGEAVLAYASRVISADKQTMVVTQSGLRPDETPFNNRAIYRRA